MLADELKIGEKVIISLGGYQESYCYGTIVKITQKRKDITVNYYGKYDMIFDCNGSSKTSDRWVHHDYILKLNKENIEKYSKYNKKYIVNKFIKNFDLKDETMIDKMYEFILKIKENKNGTC